MHPFPLDPQAPPDLLEPVFHEVFDLERPRHVAAQLTADLIVAGAIPQAAFLDTARQILDFLDPDPVDTAATRDALGRLLHLHDTDTAVHSSLWDEAWGFARRALTEEDV